LLLKFRQRTNVLRDYAIREEIPTRRRSESAYIRQQRWFGDGHGLGRDMGCMREMADALWEGHTLLKTGLSAHRHTHRDRQTKVRTVYPLVSLRSLGGYNKLCG